MRGEEVLGKISVEVNALQPLSAANLGERSDTWLSEVRIIQGGMGVAISGWRLAAAVGCLPGCLGVVSGTAIDTVLARRLQDGDPGGPS